MSWSGITVLTVDIRSGCVYAVRRLRIGLRMKIKEGQRGSKRVKEGFRVRVFLA
jgi:hypothetical protein